MGDTSKLESDLIALISSEEFLHEIFGRLLVLLAAIFFAFWVNHLLNKRARKNAPTEICEKIVQPEDQKEEGIDPSNRKLGCLKCDGHYVFEYGSREVKCSHYPRCNSTLSLYDFIRWIVDEYGINIYAWEKQCYACNKKTTVYSYYLAYDFKDLIPALEQCDEIGLGHIPSLDRLVAEKYPHIEERFFTSSDERYMANICVYCHRPQGRFFVVEDPDEIREDLIENENMEQYFVGTIMIADENVMSDIADTIINAMGL